MLVFGILNFGLFLSFLLYELFSLGIRLIKALSLFLFVFDEIMSLSQLPLQSLFFKILYLELPFEIIDHASFLFSLVENWISILVAFKLIYTSLDLWENILFSDCHFKTSSILIHLLLIQLSKRECAV